MTNYAKVRLDKTNEPSSPYSPLPPDNDWEDQPSKKWQITPPVVTAGRIASVNSQRPVVPYTPAPPPTDRDMHRQDSAPTALPQQEAPSLFRVSFVGPDQQWYSLKIGQKSTSQLQQVVQPQPTYQSQPLAPVQPLAQAQPTAAFQAQAVYQQPPSVQQQPALHPGWHDDRGRDDFMLGRPNTSLLEKSSSAAPDEKEEDDEKDFILQFVQPGLAGLMDGSVSTLAPIFSVAFATNNSFTAFLVGMASALGAGISMTFAEALSDDGDTTGRGNPFIRGGVTGFMTFISGVGHALPFLVPNVSLALTVAYIVVAIELLFIAGIRHKFFGTSWLLSIIQVVGGGALVFLTAILLGHA